MTKNKLLSDLEIRRLKPTGKVEVHPFGDGLFLYQTAKGSLSWVFRFKLAGKGGKVGLGAYPAVGLAAARQLASQRRAALAEGEPRPLGLRRARQSEYDKTMNGLVAGWLAAKRERWRKARAFDTSKRRLDLVLARIGELHVAEVDSALLVETIESIWPDSPSVAMRASQHLALAFQWGRARGRVASDHRPAEDVREGLPLKPPARRQPAIREIKPLREMLRTLETTNGYLTTRLLPRFQALTAVRPSEAREAEWSEIRLDDPDGPLWVIPAARMKVARPDAEPHYVPLSPGAVEVLAALRAAFPRSRYVFEQRVKQAPAPHTLTSKALCRAGYLGVHCSHGWRSAFSTIMNDRDVGNSVYVEAALAHIVRGVKGLYDRGTHLSARRALMARWEQILLEGAVPVDEIVDAPNWRAVARPLRKAA